jgi:transposase
MKKSDDLSKLSLDLFGERAEQEQQEEEQDGEARVQTPDRTQVELRAVDLEALLEPDHRARLVWGYVERQDLSALYDKIKARGSAPGRRAIDPKILFALWLYATLEGVGSGREIARLCQAHDAYRWICGGVPVNYHAVNDFRSNNEKLLDTLLSKNVATLALIGVITLKQVAQDGVKVRANAGASSFKRRERLSKQLRLAQQLVAQLKERAAKDPGEASRKAQAARERAAQETERRIRLALTHMPEVEETLARNGKDPESARVSTTDAQARRMKMADGGFRPAYNVQYAADCDSQVVVGVEVVSAGSDHQQMAPMVEQVEQRAGRAPEHWLVDGGFVSHEQINDVADKTTVLAPVPEAKPRKTNKDDDNRTPPPPGSKFEPRKGDSEAVKAWRQRMSSDDAKTLYKKRAATIECVNALARNRGLQQFRVRGQLKARAVALLHALAHNLMRMMSLSPTEIGLAGA